MKASPVTLSVAVHDRLGRNAPAQFAGIGDATLIGAPLLALVSSRECPGHILIETMDRVPDWASTGRVIVSGFHSPLEQQVLRSLLRRRGRAIKVLARGMTNYRPTPEEVEPLANGDMLVITAFPASVKRTTRETALARNRLVLALAVEHCIPYVAANSPLAQLIGEVCPVIAAA